MLTFSVGSDAATPLQALATTYKTILAGLAQTTVLRRGKIIEISVGPLSNPATNDCNILYAIQRLTADGTGVSTTPTYVPAQEGGTKPSPGSIWKANYTAEPTLTAGEFVWRRPLNQHSGFHWYAPDELGLPWPAVNNSGLACLAKCITSDFTGNVMYDLKFNE